MTYIKKSVIFDIEQRYFLLNKINVMLAKSLFTRDSHILFQSTKFNCNLITLNKCIFIRYYNDYEYK